MFTGIITDLGKVNALKRDNGLTIELSTSYDTSTIDIGASVACSGVCLTVINKKKGILFFDVSEETLLKTNISDWVKGFYVNLERPLKVGEELGGHIVTGHIDCVSEITDISVDGASKRYLISMSKKIKKLIAEKGSVTLDGTSLTVNGVGEDWFDVNLVPHTQVMTSFQFKKTGDKLNVEVDVLARYLARMNSVSF
ncbi:MAG: riboflavin synthase [Sphingomonadales bacterium]